MLKGKVVIITGAASGIGEASALKCARLEAKLVLADVNATAVEAVKTRLCQEGGVDEQDVIALRVDVSDENDVKEMVKRAVEKFGRIDLAFNNAGVEGERGVIGESTKANFDRVMNVNAGGVFLCMKYELEAMVGQIQKEGKRHYAIVNCASTAGLAAMPEFSAYCASKHAIIALTKSGALEYASKGIRINALCPGTTDTPMVERFSRQWPEWQEKQNQSIPLGRIGSTEEMANAVAWMLSEECGFMTGHTLCVDGGGMC
jgi:NAD(P)-dependent dehydrogenase (short-subunit alcohol dehydrogenase family)